MVFSSLTFLFMFLPAALLVYFIVPKRWKNLVLFLSGVIFYAYGEPVYLYVMILSVLIDFCCGYVMNRYDDKPKIRFAMLMTSVVMNLTLLGVFKYSSFFVSSINGLFGTSITDPRLPLPIGISFYTFQSMSYTIDLYRRKIPVQRNFLKFGAYVTMFPQLVAGPIVRYDDVRKELEHREVSVSIAGEGAAIFIRGLAKKTLLANNIGGLWATIKALPIDQLDTATAWMGILAFTFQIFFDFSGYSDMAIGMGKMMGFQFPENFNFPYMSKSISEFWRRWHMTLGTWFREYVYIPLGGNRKGLFKTIRNIAIVWALTGLWHGASWNFVLWGVYFGVLIILERLFLGKLLEKLPEFLSGLYTFLMVVFSWVLFEFEQIQDILRYFKAMFGGNGLGFMDERAFYYLRNYAVVFLLCILFSTDWCKRLVSWFTSRVPGAAVVFPLGRIALFAICISFLVDATYNPFLYFRF